LTTLTAHTDLGTALTAYVAPEQRAGLKTTSWRAYRSALKTVAEHLPTGTALGWLDSAEVEAGLDAMREVYSPSRVAQTRAAWRAFARWINDQHGIVVPLPPKRKRGRRSRDQGPDTELLPLPVAEAAGRIIREMGRGMTRAKLLGLQWSDLRPDTDGTLLIPHQGNSWLALPESLTPAMNVLWDHAKGDQTLPLGALLPLEPGGVQSCSLLKLRRSLRAVEDATRSQTQVAAVASVLGS